MLSSLGYFSNKIHSYHLHGEHLPIRIAFRILFFWYPSLCFERKYLSFPGLTATRLHELPWLNKTTSQRLCRHRPNCRKKKVHLYKHLYMIGQSNATDLANETTGNILEEGRCFGLLQILHSMYTIFQSTWGKN